MVDHRLATSPVLLEICASLSESDAMIRSRYIVKLVEILTIVLPKADRANQVSTPRWQCDVVATWTLVPRCGVSWVVPIHFVSSFFTDGLKSCHCAGAEGHPMHRIDHFGPNLTHYIHSSAFSAP